MEDLNVKLGKQWDGDKFNQGTRNERAENVSNVITDIWFQEHPRHLEDEDQRTKSTT